MGDKFYVILKGSLKILRLKEKFSQTTILEYLKALIKLKDSGEKAALEMSIESNLNLVPINEIQKENLNEVVRDIFSRKKGIFSQNLKKKSSVVKENIGIRPFRLENLILDQTKTFRLVENQEINIKIVGDYFGDDLDNKSKRR